MRANLAAVRREHSSFRNCVFNLVTNWQRNAGVEGGLRVRELKREVAQLCTCMATQATTLNLELHEARAAVVGQLQSKTHMLPVGQPVPPGGREHAASAVSRR